MRQTMFYVPEKTNSRELHLATFTNTENYDRKLSSQSKENSIKTNLGCPLQMICGSIMVQHQLPPQKHKYQNKLTVTLKH